MSNKLNKLVSNIIDEILKEEPELTVRRKLSYDEPSLGRPDDLSEDKASQLASLQKELNILNQQLSNANSNTNIPGNRKSQLIKSLQDRIKRKKDRIENLKKSDIEESSTTGGIDGYETPFAFSAPGTDPKKKRAVKAMDWPVVEAAQPSSWEKFLLTIEATAEGNVRDFLFDPLKEPYIDTPGDFHLQHNGPSQIVSYMKRNMGSQSYTDLYNFYKKYKTRCDAFVKKFGHTVDIHESVDFKDPEMSPKKKIAYAVRSMREQLNEIERVLDKSVNFKEEAGLKTSDFYVRTNKNLRKIGEQITRIMNKMQAIK